MADGTFTTNPGIAALDEPAIADLARRAVDLAIESKRIQPAERSDAEIDAAEVVRDYRDQTPRGIKRANRQRGAGVDPAIVLTPEGLATVVGNSIRDRRRLQHRRGQADAQRITAGIDAGEIVREQRGEAEDQAPGQVVMVEHGDPLLWLLAAEAAAEAEAAKAAEWRAAWRAAPPRPRRPRPILHLHRAAAGGAS